MKSQSIFDKRNLKDYWSTNEKLAIKKISRFLTFDVNYFQLWFLYESDLRISVREKIKEIFRFNHFSRKEK